jgi:hypothetical protein
MLLAAWAAGSIAASWSELFRYGTKCNAVRNKSKAWRAKTCGQQYIYSNHPRGDICAFGFQQL